MEKQIVLREPGIEWREDQGCWRGAIGNKHRVFCIEEYESGQPNEEGKRFQLVAFGDEFDDTWHVSLEAAKIVAEQMFTDWLRSIATITE